MPFILDSGWVIVNTTNGLFAGSYQLIRQAEEMKLFSAMTNEQSASSRPWFPAIVFSISLTAAENGSPSSSMVPRNLAIRPRPIKGLGF